MSKLIGERGSINDLTQRVIDGDGDWVALEIFDRPNVALSIIGNLEKEASMQQAMWFAKTVIKLLQNQYD